MKKSIIAVAAIILLAALLPILGNSFIKQTINDRITELKTFGLETIKDETKSSYLSTSRHIEVTLKDPQKFVAYLNTFADQQPPAYINAMVNGVVLGVDIEYSNLPFAKAFEVNLYPLTLPNDVRASLSQNDPKFLTFLKNFLVSKGIMWHISYNSFSSNFDGYIKDINQKYTLKDGTKIDLRLIKALFKGNGTLVAPNMFSSTLKAFHLNVIQKEQTFYFTLEKFASSADFDSESTYVSEMNVANVDMILQGTANDSEVHLKDLKVYVSSDAQGKNADLNSHTSFDSFSIVSKSLNALLTKFKFDITANNLDKEKYKALRKLLSNNKNQQSLIANKELQQGIVDLISNGFVVKMTQFSLDDLTLDKQTKLNGFDITSEIRFAKDKNLAQKIKLSPLMVGSDIEFTSKISIANKFYSFLTRMSPMLGTIKSYAKEEKGNLVFDIKLKDSKATVNGKTLN